MIFSFRPIHLRLIDSLVFSSLIDSETPAIQPRAFGWTAYNNYTEIYNWLDGLLAAYPGILTNHIVGYTYEGRPIRAVQISYSDVKIITSHKH